MIALLGATGHLGRTFVEFFRRNRIPCIGLSRRDLNYCDSRRLAAALREIRASFLINAAGFTGKPNVDACEDHKAECLLARVRSAGHQENTMNLVDFSSFGCGC